MNYHSFGVKPPQFFRYYNLTYDVDRGLSLVNGRDAPVVDLENDYANELYDKHKHIVTINNLHWPNTNCDEPLLFAINPNTCGHFLIDGWHRLTKAVHNNRNGISTTLKARYLTHEESMSILKACP